MTSQYEAYVKSMKARGLWRHIVREKNYDRASKRGKYANTPSRSYRYRLFQKRSQQKE